jgi:hypothetical protein
MDTGSITEFIVGLIAVIAGLAYWLGFALIPAVLARRKGYSFALFYILSLLTAWWIMLIVTFFLKDKVHTVVAGETPVIPTALPVRPFVNEDVIVETPVAPTPSWQGTQTCAVCGTKAPGSALACPRCGMPLQAT